jgi:hypothetical protein
MAGNVIFETSAICKIRACSNHFKKETEMFTNRFFNLFLAIALLIPLAIRGIGLAVTPGAEASGSFITTATTIKSVTEDKFNEIVDLKSTVTYTGALEGTSTLHGTLTVRRDGSANFKGVETFTGSVNGMPGTLTFELTGDNDIYQAIQLTNRITSGTGELAGLHGELSKQGIIKDNGPVGTYAGQINNP